MIRSAARESETLKCQVSAAGSVFFIDGASPATDSGMTPEDFAQAVSSRTARVLAIEENAALICALYARREDAIAVELGRPARFAWHNILQVGPREVLFNVRQFDNDPPSRGGWHRMTDDDLPSYQLAAHFHAGGSYNATAAAALAAHPVFPAASFIGHLDMGKLAELVAAVIDPRWFVTTDSPGRFGRLKCYLGLMPGRGPSPSRRNRRRLVLDTWKTTDTVPSCVNMPGWFLWRRWAVTAGNSVKADMRTSRVFVSYLRETWLHAMAPTTVSDGLFAPDYFFGDAAVADAWRVHVKPRTAKSRLCITET